MVFPKKITIKLEASEDIKIEVNETDTIADVIKEIKSICKERGIDLDEWAQTKLGTDRFSFLLLRK